MAIKMDSIPKNNPFQVAAPGFYRARVDKAEMLPSKTPGKPPYLSLTYSLLDAKGQKIGTVFDRLFDSTASTVLYKFGRFIEALELSLTGNVELKDLAKIIVGKKFCVEITHEADNRFPDDRSKDRAVPKLFKSEIFWPFKDAASLIVDEGDTDEVVEVTDADIPFSTTDEDTEY